LSREDRFRKPAARGYDGRPNRSDKALPCRAKIVSASQRLAATMGGRIVATRRCLVERRGFPQASGSRLRLAARSRRRGDPRATARAESRTGRGRIVATRRCLVERRSFPQAGGSRLRLAARSRRRGDPRAAPGAESGTRGGRIVATRRCLVERRPFPQASGSRLRLAARSRRRGDPGAAPGAESGTRRGRIVATRRCLADRRPPEGGTTNPPAAGRGPCRGSVAALRRFVVPPTGGA